MLASMNSLIIWRMCLGMSDDAANNTLNHLATFVTLILVRINLFSMSSQHQMLAKLYR